jgi:integrase
MPRETSPLIIGDFWLDRRRDGASPEIWQIARYDGQSRSIVYRSTKQRSVEAAGLVLRAHEALQRSTGRGQSAETAELVPHLFNYLREHGPDVGRLDTIETSFRAWIGFLEQDDLTTGAKVADISKISVARFRRWRMGPHSWSIEWDGKVYNHSSEGVTGLTVQRNIEDLRAALHHADGLNRFEAPKVPSVDKKLRVKRKRKTLTVAQLGALWGYARDDTGIWRELALMLGTACRPGVAQAFDPRSEQWQDDVIDLQPDGRPLTDKRNAIAPVIAPLRPILDGWKEKPHAAVKSRKKWWGTARRVLGLPDIEAYDIRHTVSTMLDEEGVPGAQISGLTGHLPESRGIARTTSQHYLHYDPHNCPKLKRALTKFFTAVEREAALWSADHLRTIPIRGKPIKIERVLEKC